MSNRARVERFLRQANLATAALAAGRGLCRALAVVPLLLLFAALDNLLHLSALGREVLWCLFVAASVTLFASGFWPLGVFHLSAKSRALAGRVREMGDGSFRSDELRIALDLARRGEGSGTSDTLADRYLNRVSERLSAASPAWCFPKWRWRRNGALALAALLVSAGLQAFFPMPFAMGERVLFPFGGRGFSNQISVAPGDARVPWGQDATIRLELKAAGAESPGLQVRAGSDWRPVDADDVRGPVQTFTVKRIVQPVQYRVVWRGETGRRYTITPSEPVDLTRFQIRVRPPEYVGAGDQTQDSPEIRGLAGSVVTLEATATVPLESATLVFSDGSERPARVTDGKTVQSSFVLEKEGTYDFRFKTASGDAALTRNAYPVHVTPDNPPTITLLSPDQDLQVGEHERVPLTYDARDDFGVREINLLWKAGNGPERRTTLTRMTSSSDGSLHTHNWDVARLGVPPGTVIQYRLEAVDGNIVTGPGRATTEARLIEISSFEREHERLEAALEQWRDMAVETLADVNTLKAKVDKPDADLTQLTSRFNDAASKSARLEEALSRIVDRMQKDPMADYGVMVEHQAMLDTLKALNNTVVRSAQAAFQTQNKSSASANLDQMSSELERMSALSEDLSKEQKARDVTDAGENLEKLGQEMADRLKEGGDKSEVADQVNRLLQEAQKQIADMARALQQMPQELPEDFVNQQALKNLDLGKTDDILSQIQKAMKAGDMDKALSLAKQFLEAAQKMKRQLAQAHEQYAKNNSPSELERKIAEQAKNLDAITDEQRQLLAQTQEFESKRMAAMLEAQKKEIAALAERQAKAIERTRAVLSRGKANPSAFATLANLLTPMEQVLSELRHQSVDKSPTLLGVIVAGFDAADKNLRATPESVPTADEARAIGAEEKSIWDELKKSGNDQPPQNLSPEEQQAFDASQKRQGELSRKTQTLRQDLQTLSRKTASLGLPLTQALSKAAGEMSAASDQLGRRNSRSAQSSQENALELLQQSQASLEQAQGALDEMAGQSGSGSGGLQVVARPGGAGQSGNRNGKVRLPSADDYRPPKEFREDLMESLKEKYPKIYEDIIQKYYKRLAE